LKIQILLFHSIKTGCFVGYNAYYVLHFVSAIIYRNTKNIKDATANHKFPNEYIDVIFIHIDQHLKILLKKIQRGPDFMKHGVEKTANSLSNVV